MQIMPNSHIGTALQLDRCKTYRSCALLSILQ